MKKFVFSALCLVCFSLESTHFQSTMSVSPMSSKNTFLVEMEIEKVIGSHSELMASPKIICVQGVPAELKIESSNQEDLLFIQVMIPENLSQTVVQASVLMKEKNQVVLSLNNVVKMNAFN